jgi:tryptophanase
MEAIAIGLREVFDPNYLDYRIKSTLFLGQKLHDLGVPLMRPIGGHAVYIDAKKLYATHSPASVSGAGFGGRIVQAGRHPQRGDRFGDVRHLRRDGTLKPSPMELVRLAIPRRVYTQSHIEYVVETFEELMKQREHARGVRITKEPRFLRHFTAHFEPLA